jgi:ABC-type spermidine/putrescine transport system permease subunit II
MTNWNWKFVRIGCAAAALALVAAGSVMAAAGSARPVMAFGVNHQNNLTFNRPVALPGVVLPAGTYSFYVATDTALDVVVVRNTRGNKVLYTGFGTRANRPAGMSWDTSIVVGEAAPGNQAPPITTWYEIGRVMGHEFRY